MQRCMIRRAVWQWAIARYSKFQLKAYSQPSRTPSPAARCFAAGHTPSAVGHTSFTFTFHQVAQHAAIADWSGYGNRCFRRVR